MRVVDGPADFAAALAGARREAKAAFGDDRMLIEKYLRAPRHIEVQIFADSHGHALHLFERDCSMQRRHQKVIEEAPAPGLPDALRRRWGGGRRGGSRRRLCRRRHGGVHCSIGDKQFYFMEMNTRLQVEHPVTEMITGLDLVEWQLRVAAGEPLPLEPGAKSPRAAMPSRRGSTPRIPARDFLPSTGRLLHFRVPEGERSHSGRYRRAPGRRDRRPLRSDAGQADRLGSGSRGRLPAPRRSSRRNRDRRPRHQRDFLAAVARHPAFIAGEIDTGFIARHSESLLRESPRGERGALAAAVLWMVGQERRNGAEAHVALAGGDGWRLNLAARREFHFLDAGEERRVILGYGACRHDARFRPGGPARYIWPARRWPAPGRVWRPAPGCDALSAAVARSMSSLRGSEYRLDLVDPLARGGSTKRRRAA